MKPNMEFKSLNPRRAQEAREARHAGQDIKRQKMRADLEARERTVATARNEEATARAKLKVRPPKTDCLPPPGSLGRTEAGHTQFPARDATNPWRKRQG